MSTLFETINDTLTIAPVAFPDIHLEGVQIRSIWGRITYMDDMNDISFKKLAEKINAILEEKFNETKFYEGNNPASTIMTPRDSLEKISFYFINHETGVRFAIQYRELYDDVNEGTSSFKYVNLSEIDDETYKSGCLQLNTVIQWLKL